MEQTHIGSKTSTRDRNSIFYILQFALIFFLLINKNEGWAWGSHQMLTHWPLGLVILIMERIYLIQRQGYVKSSL